MQFPRWEEKAEREGNKEVLMAKERETFKYAWWKHETDMKLYDGENNDDGKMHKILPENCIPILSFISPSPTVAFKTMQL